MRVLICVEMQSPRSPQPQHTQSNPAGLLWLRLCVSVSVVHFRADFDLALPNRGVVIVEAPGAFIDRPETLPYSHLRPGVRLKPGGTIVSAGPAVLATPNTSSSLAKL